MPGKGVFMGGGTGETTGRDKPHDPVQLRHRGRQPPDIALVVIVLRSVEAIVGLVLGLVLVVLALVLGPVLLLLAPVPLLLLGGWKFWRLRHRMSRGMHRQRRRARRLRKRVGRSF